MGVFRARHGIAARGSAQVDAGGRAAWSLSRPPRRTTQRDLSERTVAAQLRTQQGGRNPVEELVEHLRPRRPTAEQDVHAQHTDGQNVVRSGQPKVASGTSKSSKYAEWEPPPSEDLDTCPGTDAPATIQPATTPSTVKDRNNPDDGRIDDSPTCNTCMRMWLLPWEEHDLVPPDRIDAAPTDSRARFG